MCCLDRMVKMVLPLAYRQISSMQKRMHTRHLSGVCLLYTSYVYYNYVTKTFMDAFVTDDKHNEVETGSRYDGRIKFDLGTVANRDWKNGIILNVDTSAIVEPTPYDVIAICKKHNRRTRNLGFMDEEMDDIKSMAEAEKEKNRGEDMDPVSYTHLKRK